ncbi:MAG: glycosyltransferase family 39 protein [Ktedonobacterales bacterium]
MMMVRLWVQTIRSSQRADDGKATLRRPSISKIFLADWNGPRFLTFGIVVTLLASLVTLGYYMNEPGIPGDPDTSGYLLVAHKVAHGQFLDPVRTPAYPLFIDLILLFAGRNNLVAISIAQGVLYIVAAVGVYGLACLIFHKAWIALVIAVPVATNVLLISYVQPIMTEALALFLLVCLALALVRIAQAPQPRILWLAMGILFALGMTRPEWLYFVVPFVGFVLLVSWKHGAFRQVLPHALTALVLFSALCGLYLYGNARQGYAGFGENQNEDLLGKVMQYHMQNEAPPQYAAITQHVNAILALGDENPGHVIFGDPPLESNHFTLAASYGRTIILRHPVEFIADTVPVVFQSLRSTDPHQDIRTNGPFSGVLFILQAIANLVQYSLLVFPFIAVAWWIRLFLLRRPDALTFAMAGLSLIGGYDLAVTTLFVYTQYARMNVPYDALMITVVWGSIICAGVALARSLASKRHAQMPHSMG